MWPKRAELITVSIKLDFWCIVTGYLNVCLIELLPAVPGMRNRSLETETESNDLQILTVSCSGWDLNASNREENYKVCFTSLMHPWHSTMNGERCRIPADPYGGVGLLALPFAHQDRSFAAIRSLSSTYQKTLLNWRGEKSPMFLYFELDNIKWTKWPCIHIIQNDVHAVLFPVQRSSTLL